MANPNQRENLKPFVLQQFAQRKEYDPINWSLEELPKWLKDETIMLRLSSLNHVNGKIIFEKMCSTAVIQAQQFIKWMKGNLVIHSSGNDDVESSSHWAYYDYKPAAECFTEVFTSALSFEKLGITGKFNDETIWVGSPGAYTPCHYDSYGYNIHVQLKGTKRWILFPPDTHLSPSRIPYEESTIYSSFDIIGAQLPSTGPQNGYCVYLEEGDLLFIPPKWWHSVQCYQGDDLGGIFSVNKWFPLESDEEERKKECIVGCLASLINYDVDKSNTDEENEQEKYNLMEATISEVFQSKINETEPVKKRQKTEAESKPFQQQMMAFYDEYSKVAEKLPQMSFDELKKEIASKRCIISGRKDSATVPEEDEEKPFVFSPEYEELPYTTPNIRKLFNAITHESTLQNVMRLMKENDV